MTSELAGNSQGGNVTVEGYTPPVNEDFDIEESTVNSDYFHAMQVPIAVGRAFTDADDAKAQPVAIVNETFVRHYFKDASSAIGRRVAKGSGNNLHYMIIVGVVRDTQHTNLRDPSLPTLFMPLEQVDAPGQLFLYLRTATPPEQMFADGAKRGALDRSGVDYCRPALDGRSDRREHQKRTDD